MRFLLLGPMQVSHEHGALALGTPKQRTLLAFLIMNAGHRAGLDDLVDELWETDPPASAVANVRTYAANLRRTFAAATGGAGPLVRSGDGYLLDVAADHVDVAVFEQSCRRARAAAGRADFPAAATAWREAERQWRGAEPDIPLGARLRGWWRTLTYQRLDATDGMAEALLHDGRPEETIGLLREHVSRNPLRERSALLLAAALYAAGDCTEALSVIASLRTRLAEDLALNPGPQIQALRQAILRREPDTVTAARPAAAQAAGPSARPAQLPREVTAFTGRGAEIAALDDLLRTTTAPAVVVLAGIPGVGKTSLAVRWAHRVRARFPDGQLYVSMRGIGAGEAVMSPDEALRGFLQALMVPADRMPEGTGPLAALFRSLTADRRMIIVLDNVRDAEQVRPLLPGTPGCAVVITSRLRLTSLVMAEGVRELVVGALPDPQARALLTRRLQAAGVIIAGNAVDELIRRCAGLPLALAIAAGYAATRRHTDFGETTEGVPSWDGGDAATSLRAIFSSSYRALSPTAARGFRLLGLLPGAGRAALTSLFAADPEPALRELCQASLLSEHRPGRYVMHDLLRAYAEELAHEPAHAEQSAAGSYRAIAHYLHTACHAAMRLYPYREPIDLPALPDGVVPEPLAGHREALAWFTAERETLIAMVRRCAEAGLAGHTWRIAWALYTFFDRQGHWADLAETQQSALRLATHAKDRHGQAHAHRGIARAFGLQGRYPAAEHHYRAAIADFAALDEPHHQARVRLNLAWALERQGRLPEALAESHQAYALFERGRQLAGQANALNAIGWYLAQQGEHHRTLDFCGRAIALHQDVGNQLGEANTWDSLGYAHQHLTAYADAETCYLRAIELYREMADRSYEAKALTHLGDNYRDAGRPADARRCWQSAHTILADLDHSDATGVRDRLASLSRRSADRTAAAGGRQDAGSTP